MFSRHRRKQKTPSRRQQGLQPNSLRLDSRLYHSPADATVLPTDTPIVPEQSHPQRETLTNKSSAWSLFSSFKTSSSSRHQLQLQDEVHRLVEEREQLLRMHETEKAVAEEMAKAQIQALMEMHQQEVETLRKETDSTVRLLIGESMQPNDDQNPETTSNTPSKKSTLTSVSAAEYTQMLAVFKEIHEQALQVLAKEKDAQIALEKRKTYLLSKCAKSQCKRLRTELARMQQELTDAKQKAQAIQQAGKQILGEYDATQDSRRLLSCDDSADSGFGSHSLHSEDRLAAAEAALQTSMESSSPPVVAVETPTQEPKETNDHPHPHHHKSKTLLVIQDLSSQLRSMSRAFAKREKEYAKILEKKENTIQSLQAERDRLKAALRAAQRCLSDVTQERDSLQEQLSEQKEDSQLEANLEKKLFQILDREKTSQADPVLGEHGTARVVDDDTTSASSASASFQTRDSSTMIDLAELVVSKNLGLDKETLEMVLAAIDNRQDRTVASTASNETLSLVDLKDILTKQGLHDSSRDYVMAAVVDQTSKDGDKDAASNASPALPNEPNVALIDLGERLAGQNVNDSATREKVLATIRQETEACPFPDEWKPQAGWFEPALPAKNDDGSDEKTCTSEHSSSETTSVSTRDFLQGAFDDPTEPQQATVLSGLEGEWPGAAFGAPSEESQPHVPQQDPVKEEREYEEDLDSRITDLESVELSSLAARNMDKPVSWRSDLESSGLGDCPEDELHVDFITKAFSQDEESAPNVESNTGGNRRAPGEDVEPGLVLSDSSGRSSESLPFSMDPFGRDPIDVLAMTTETPTMANKPWYRFGI